LLEKKSCMTAWPILNLFFAVEQCSLALRSR